MIDAIRSYSNHSLIGIIAEGIPTILKLRFAMITRVALNILFHSALFYYHPNLFPLGFICGVFFDKKVANIVKKVNIIYNAHKTFLEQVLLFGGGGFLFLLTMPFSRIITTLYYSSQLGALIYKKCLNGVSPLSDPTDEKEVEKEIDNLPDI